MELRRKALKQLEQWKTESQGRTALLIEGARHVEKSHLIRTFVQSAYRSAVIIDFSDIQPVVRKFSKITPTTGRNFSPVCRLPPGLSCIRGSPASFLTKHSCIPKRDSW